MTPPPPPDPQPHQPPTTPPALNDGLLTQPDADQDLAHWLELHFDGGHRESDSLSAAGWVLDLVSESSRARLMEEAILLPGDMTVNEAEYTGCSSGLEAVIMMAERHSLPRFVLKVFGDSRLVIGQVNGTKMVDKEHLEPFLAKVRQHTIRLQHRQCELDFVWKRRAENKEAD